MSSLSLLSKTMQTLVTYDGLHVFAINLEAEQSGVEIQAKALDGRTISVSSTPKISSFKLTNNAPLDALTYSRYSPSITPIIDKNSNLNLIIQNILAFQILKSSDLKSDWNKYIKILEQNNITTLYHFTAKRNLAQIKANGGLYSWHSLINRNINVPIYGGNNLSRKLDSQYGNQDFVHLSFCDDHPMSYKLQQEGEEVVLLEISPIVAVLKETIFSNINATDKFHRQGKQLDDLKLINFDATKLHYLKRTDENFKLHQAEVMVEKFIPLKYIFNLEQLLSNQ